MAYLQSIGVDPAIAVRWVVATHWHDDHVRGLDQLLRACKSARLAMSSATCADEFVQGFGTVPQREGGRGVTSGVQTMAATLEVLKDRAGHLKVRRSLDSGKPLDLPSRPGPERSAVALSPSDLDETRAVDRLRRLFRRALSGRLDRLPSCKRNPSSVVLSIRLGETAVLLGGDLETGRNPLGGWDAVVSDHGGRVPLAELCKIAHHGSPNGDHDGIWERLLATDPVGVLAPWTGPSDHRPRKEDRERLLGRTPHVFLTAPPGRRSVPPSAPGDPVLVPVPSAGRVTARRRGTADPRSHLAVRDRWEVELSGAAAAVAADG